MTKDELNVLEEEVMIKLKNMDEISQAFYYRNLFLLDMRLEKAENIIRKARDDARKKWLPFNS